jgi:hypothetical protein
LGFQWLICGWFCCCTHWGRRNAGKEGKKIDREEKENGNSKKINILNRMVKKIKNLMQLM